MGNSLTATGAAVRALPNAGRAGNFDQLAAEPIFVGGHVRSGTTWVYDLLTSHELVAGVFESWVFSPLYGIGGVLASEQWDPEQVQRMAPRTGRPYGLHQMVSRKEVAADVRRLLEKWMGRVLEAQHRYLVEKTPPHLEGMREISEIFPEARFIHVVRDGRDVVVSLRAAAQSWNRGFESMDGRLFYKPAQNWKSTVTTISKVGASLGDRFMEVRYEDLQNDPGLWLKRLLDFCGIPHDPPLVERIVAANRFHSRFTGSEDAFRRKGRVGDWRRHFDRFDAIAFDIAAGKMLIEKGYEKNRRWWMRPGRGPKCAGG